MATEIDEFLW